jgi:hypothetical protein
MTGPVEQTYVLNDMRHVDLYKTLEPARYYREFEPDAAQSSSSAGSCMVFVHSALNIVEKKLLICNRERGCTYCEAVQTSLPYRPWP